MILPRAHCTHGSPSVCQQASGVEKTLTSMFVHSPVQIYASLRGVHFVHNNSDQMLSQFPSTFLIIHVFASSLKIYPVSLESQWKGLFAIFAEATVKREMFSLPWLQPVAICFSKCSQTRGRKMC